MATRVTHWEITGMWRGLNVDNGTERKSWLRIGLLAERCRAVLELAIFFRFSAVVKVVVWNSIYLFYNIFVL